MPSKTKDTETLRRELCASFEAVAEAARNCAQIASNFSKYVSHISPSAFEELTNKERASGKRKRKQREKDPNKPKRPTSAFLHFQNEVRKYYQDRMAGKPYSEIMTEIAKHWKELPEEKKNFYKRKVEAEKVLYGEKMKEYQKRKASPEPMEASAKKKVAARQDGITSTEPSDNKSSESESEETSPVVAAMNKEESEDGSDEVSESSSDEESEQEEQGHPSKKPKSGKASK